MYMYYVVKKKKDTFSFLKFNFKIKESKCVGPAQSALVRKKYEHNFIVAIILVGNCII